MTLLSAPPTIPNNLPVQVTTFVGRNRELAEVKRLVSGHNLVTMTGMGGTGKTRLALEAAQSTLQGFPGGVWFVDLSPVADPHLVPQTFGAALGIGEEAGRAMTDTVAHHLQGKHALILIDNAEHVLEAARQVCARILEEGAFIQLLVTSRVPLQLEGERVYKVPSLSMPDPSRTYTPQSLEQFEAVRLFIDRASRNVPGFEVSAENSALLVRVCRRMEGMPLAIELAAAWVGKYDLDEVVSRIDSRFDQITSSGRSLPKAQILRAMIAWSYDLLTEEQQSVLRRLGVFAGGWRLSAAIDICDDLTPATNHQVMSELVERALVVHDAAAERYRLLETVRAYARDALEETDHALEARDKHLTHFFEVAVEAEPHLSGPDAKDYLQRLDEEHENLRAAIEWGLKGGDKLAALRLACSLSTFYQVRGMFEEGCHTYTMFLKSMGAGRTSLVAEARWSMGVLLFRQGQYGRTRQEVGIALDIFEELRDDHGTAKALNTLAVVALQLAEYDRAAPLFERALRLFKATGEERRVAMTLNNLGILAVHLGDLPRARELYEEALEVNKRAGNQRFEAGNLTNLADLALRMGDAKKARELARRACLLHLALGDRQNLQDTFEVLAPAELRCGRPYIAATLFANKEAMMTELGTTVAPFVAEEYRRNVEAVRAALGDDAFDAAFTEGRALSAEDAFRASLEDL